MSDIPDRGDCRFTGILMPPHSLGYEGSWLTNSVTTGRRARELAREYSIHLAESAYGVIEVSRGTWVAVWSAGLEFALDSEQARLVISGKRPPWRRRVVT